jgi:hypothetical protein
MGVKPPASLPCSSTFRLHRQVVGGPTCSRTTMVGADLGYVPGVFALI